MNTGGDHETEKSEPFEVDFTFWYQRDHLFNHDEEPVLVFGEAKSFAVDSFEEKDITRMRRLAEKFPGAFLVFAMLKDALTAPEKAEIAALATWGRELLLDNLCTLADLAQQASLGLPDSYAALHEQLAAPHPREPQGGATFPLMLLQCHSRSKALCNIHRDTLKIGQQCWVSPYSITVRA
jgi:hypothetical protein